MLSHLIYIQLWVLVVLSPFQRNSFTNVRLTQVSSTQRNFRAKVWTKFCLIPKLYYFFINCLETEVLAGDYIYSMAFSNIAHFSWNATLTCSQMDLLAYQCQICFLHHHHHLYSSLAFCSYTEVDWNDITCGPHQPLLFRSYSKWRLDPLPTQSHPFHICDTFYLYHIPERKRKILLVSHIEKFLSPTWVTQGHRESVAELWQDPRSPDWRPLLDLHLTTLFGALEKIYYQSFNPTQYTWSSFPHFPFKGVSLSEFQLNLKHWKPPFLDAMIVGLLPSTPHPSTLWCDWLPCMRALNLLGGEPCLSVLPFTFAFADLFIYLFIIFVFLGPHLWHMEVPRLGVQSKL